MATEQMPLLFFKARPHVDAAAAAQALLGGSTPPGVDPIEPEAVLEVVRKTRGFARLKVALPAFGFDDPRSGAAFEGTACPTHLHVRFYGDFDKVAALLFNVLTANGMSCYSVWDESVVLDWPRRDEPAIDPGFAARMERLLEHKARELREAEPDEKRRRQMLDQYAKSPEFRAEMAREARREAGGRGPKAYEDFVNCYVRWKDGRASVAELGAVRKLYPKLAAMSLPQLRAHAGDAPRLLVATAVEPQEAAELRREAKQAGLTLDIEPP